MIFGIGTSYIYFAVNILVSLLLIPIMIRYLGQVQFGAWMTIISIIGYVGVLDFGATFAVSKFVSEYYAKQDQKNLNAAISTSLIQYSVLGMLAMIIVLIISIYLASFLGFSGSLARTVWIAFIILGMNLAITLPSNVLGSVLYGHHRIAEFNIINILGVIMNATAVIILLFLNVGLVGVAAAMLMSNLIVALTRFLYIKFVTPHVSIRFNVLDKGMFMDIFSFSFYIFLLNIGSQVVFNTGNIVIAKALGTGAVAAYAVAFRLNQVITALVNRISNVFYPFFTELHTVGEKKKLADYYSESTKLSMAFATPLVFCMYYWGGKIISSWVGAENFVGMPVLSLLLLITIMCSVIYPGFLALQGIGKVKTLVGFNVFEALINIVLSIIFVFKYGIFGVALGAVIAMALSNFWYVPYRACRELGINIFIHMITNVIWPVIIGLSLFVFARYLDILITTDNLFLLLIKSIIIFLTYIFIFIVIGVNRKRRSLYIEKIIGAKNVLIRWVFRR